MTGVVGFQRRKNAENAPPVEQKGAEKGRPIQQAFGAIWASATAGARRYPKTLPTRSRRGVPT